MSERDHFGVLQERWVSDEPLSEAEERARRDAAKTDELARRELEWFGSLARAGSEPGPEPSPTLISRTLGALRGAHLRLVGPDERRAPAERGRARAAFLAVAGASGLALGAMWWFTRHPAPTPARARDGRASETLAVAPAPPARIEMVFRSGVVSVDDQVTAIGRGLLKVGQRIATEAGRACVSIDPAIDVCLDARTSLSVESLEETRIALRVTRGRAVAALSPRNRGSTFSLLLGNATATARGTVFAAEVATAREGLAVVVVEGKVEVTRPGVERAFVPAHSRLDFDAKSSRVSSAIGRNDEAELMALLEPRDLWQERSLGVLDLGAGQPGAQGWVDGHGPFELPLSLFVAAGRHQLTLREKGGERGAEVQVKAASIEHVSGQDFRAAETHVAKAALPPARELLDDARKRLGSGDALGARALYEKLRASYPASPEAFTVLVTLGKLDLQLGAPARAITHFDSYLKRGGPLAPEALSGKIRALRATGRAAEERAAIQTYLARYENGFDAPALQKRLEALH
jgi:hypothetical protein